MAIAYVSTGAYASDASAVTLGTPAGSSNGNLFVAFVGVQDSNATAGVTTPSGWNLITSVVTSSGTYTRLYAFWTILSGGTTYVFNTTAGSGSLNGVDGIIRAYSGTKTTAVVNSFNSAAESGGTIIVPALTETFQSGEWYVTCCSDGNNGTPSPISPALSNSFHDNGSNNSYTAGDYIPVSSPGTETYTLGSGLAAAIGLTILPSSSASAPLPSTQIFFM